MLLKRSLQVCAVLLMAVFSITIVGCGQDANGEKNPESKKMAKKTGGNGDVAISVNDETVSMSEFQQRIDQQMAQLRKNPQFNKQFKRMPKSKKKMMMKQYKSRIKRRLSDQMISKMLIKQEAENAGISISDKEIDQKWEEFKQQVGSKKKLDMVLKKQNKSPSQVKSKIKERLLLKKFMDERLKNIEVTDSELEKQFKKNKKKYSRPEQVKARHILVREGTGAKSKIEDIESRIDNGENFEKVAREESEGPSSKRGGQLGYFGKSDMVGPFADAAFGLNIGEISDPVKTKYGYHLIKVEGKRDAKSAQMSDVEDTVAETVRQRKKREKAKQLLKKLREEANIENNVVSQKSGMPGGMKKKRRRSPRPKPKPKPKPQPQQ